MAQFKGIDVSRWQGNINWPAVKASGIQFAILKAGGSDAGFYKDPTFEQNYAGAKAAGVAVGAYYFVGAGCQSRADGIADANRFKAYLAGKQFEYPVYIDFEAPAGNNKAGNTEACIGFCQTMQAAGYYCGIYASDLSGFQSRLNKGALTAFTWWVARYGSAVAYAKENCHIWQYSSSGRVGGIAGNVDMDISYVDFASLIKSQGYNGYKKGSAASPSKPAVAPAPAKKSNEVIASEVLAGKWGNGDDRKARLSAAGYDYNAIQAIVNQKTAPAKKSNTQIAQEVIAGKWGNGVDRTSRLAAAGYDANAVQSEVNKLLGAKHAPSASVIHVVKAGETLSGIAAKYGTTYQHLAQINGIANPNLIRVGQRIKIK